MPELASEIVDSIDRIAAGEWNALCGERAFVDHRWLRMVEAVLSEYEPRYVVLRYDGQLAAAAVCSLERRFEQPALQRRAKWVLRRFPYVRCGIPIVFEAGLIVDPRADERALVPELLKGVRRVARAERALLTTFGHLTPDSLAWPALRAGGCRQLSRWWTTALTVSWSSFDQYLASRSSADRKEIGRLRRRAEREGITVEHGPLQVSDAPRLRQLIDNVLARHQASDPYAPEFLGAAAGIVDTDLRVVQARHDGDVVGCAVLVKSRNELLAKWTGMDYQRTRGSAAYHAVLIGCIEMAIELGVDRLRLGASAYSTKQQFGAVPQERLNALALPTWLAAVVPGSRLPAAGGERRRPAFR